MAASDFTRAGSPITAAGYNLNVAATRAATINSASGATFDRNPMGDTTIHVPQPHRLIRNPRELLFAPFTLRVVNVGTDDLPTYRKLFYFPDGSCDVAEGWASCANQAYSGLETWAKNGDWFYIADADGKAEGSATLDQKKIEYVYLHVLSGYDGYKEEGLRTAIVSNAQKIPEAFGGLRDDCICIGRFTVPTDTEIAEGVRPKVQNQFVSGQVQIYGSWFPFKLSVVNIGSDDNPEWVKCFYGMEGSVLFDGDVYGACQNMPFLDSTNPPPDQLYFIAKKDGSTGPGSVPLQEDVEYAYLHVKKTADNKCQYVVTCDDTTIPTAFGGSEDYCCCLGRFSVPTHAQVQAGVVPVVEEQFVSSQVQVGAGDAGTNPFKLLFADDDLIVYLPSGCMQNANNGGNIGTIMGVDTSKCEPVKGYADWYYVKVPSTLASPSDIFCHYDTANNSFYVDTSAVDANHNGFRIGTVEKVAPSAGATPQWTVTKQHIRDTVIGYARSEDTSQYPLKLRVRLEEDGTYRYEVLAPTGSVCVANANVYDSVCYNLPTTSTTWKYIAGLIPPTTMKEDGCFAVYAIGAVEYVAKNGASDEEAQVMVPNRLHYLVTTDENVADALARMGISYDSDHPWRHFKTLIGTIDYDDKSVYTQDTHGTITVMAPMDPTSATPESSKIGTLETKNALLRVNENKVTPQEGEPYYVYTIEELEERLVIEGETKWEDTEALKTLFDAFEFTSTPPTGKSKVTLSTDKLRYPEKEGPEEHKNTCFLTVNADRYVEHGGNQQYDCLTEIWTNLVSYDVKSEEEEVENKSYLEPGKIKVKFESQHEDVQVLGIPGSKKGGMASVQLINNFPSTCVSLGIDQKTGEDVKLSAYVTADGVSASSISGVSDGVLCGNGEGHIGYKGIGPENGKVAAGDHTHGNISSSGVLTYQDEEEVRTCVKGQVLVTGEAGVIEDNKVSWIQAGLPESTTNLDLLNEVMALFDFKSDEFGNIETTLSTDKLKYKGKEEHKSNCLLTVDKDGYVVHSGNRMYDMLNAATENEVKKANKIVTDKDIGSGLKYDAGTVQAKVKTGGGIGVDATEGLYLGGLEGTGFVYTQGGTLSVPDTQPIVATKNTGVFYNDNGTVSFKTIGDGENDAIAASKHAHGNLTWDGKITDTPKGVLLFTDKTSGAITTAATIIPTGYDFENDVELLSAVAESFKQTKPGVIKMPTSSLTCDVEGHKDKCILIADGESVTHSGNRMYDMLNAATENEVKKANKIVTDKDIGSGLKYDAGTVQAKVKSGGGIGLNATDGLYIGNIGTGTEGFVRQKEGGGLEIPPSQPIALDSTKEGLVYAKDGSVDSYKTIGDGSGFDVAAGNHTHSEYAPSSHHHGHIDKDGYLTHTVGSSEEKCGSGKFLVTGTNGIIEQNAPTWVPSGITGETDLSVLKSLIGTFDYDKSGGSLAITLSTDKLKYMEHEGEKPHENTCFLEVDEHGLVKHGGNEQYCDLKAVSQAFSYSGEMLSVNYKAILPLASIEKPDPLPDEHPPKILGIDTNQKVLSYIDGIASSIVQVGKIEENPVYLSSVINWDNGKVNEGSVDYNGNINITSGNYTDYAADKNHGHGKITSAGKLDDAGEVSAKNRVVVTNDQREITFDSSLSTSILGALSRGATVHTPTGSETFDPYVTAFTVKDSNSSTVGVVMDGPNRKVGLGDGTTQSTISNSTSGLLELNAIVGLNLSAPANMAKLTASPNGSHNANSLSIATCGWVVSNTPVLGDTGVLSSKEKTGGGYELEYKTVGDGSSYDIASGNHTHTGYAPSDHVHGNISNSGALTYKDGTETKLCEKGKLLVTGDNGVITFNTVLDAITLEGVSRAATVVSPTAEQTFNPYVSAIQVKSNSTDIGISLNGPTKTLAFGEDTEQCSIVGGSAGKLTLESVSEIELDAPTNMAKLTNAPSGTLTSASLAIATCGWVLNNTLTLGGDGVLHSKPKAGGGYELEYKTVGDGSAFDIASGGHTHDEYASAEHVHGDINNDGTLKDDGSVSSANHLLITNENKKITFDKTLSVSTLGAVSRAATVRNPSGSESFDPYVTALEVKASNSTTVGVKVDGPNRSLCLGTGTTESKLSSSSTGLLSLLGITGVEIDAPQNTATLKNAPSNGQTSTSKAIATCGWVIDNTLTLGNTGVLSSKAKAGGGYELEYKTIGNGTSFDIASGSHTHSGYAASDHEHGNINTDGTLKDGSGGVSSASRVLITDANKKVSFSSLLTEKTLGAISASATVTDPGSGTSPYVSDIKVRRNSNLVGLELRGSDETLLFGTTTTQSSIANDSGTLKLLGNSGIILSASLMGITLTAPENQAKLTNAPTVAKTVKDSNAIATCGWVASNFESLSVTGTGFVYATQAGETTSYSTKAKVAHDADIDWGAVTNITSANLGTAGSTLFAPYGTVSFPGFGDDHTHAAYGDHTHSHEGITDFDTAVDARITADASLLRKADKRTEGAGKILSTDDICPVDSFVPCGEGHAVCPPNHKHTLEYVYFTTGGTDTLSVWKHPSANAINGQKVGNLEGGKFVKTTNGGYLTVADKSPALVPTTVGVVKSDGTQLTAGALVAGDIPALSAAKITSGTFDIGRLPTGTTSGTVANGDHVHGNIDANGKMTQAATCFVTTDTDGNVIQLPNTTASGGMAISDVKNILTTSNLEAAGTVTLKAEVAKFTDATGSKVVETDASGLLVESDKSYARFDTTPVGSALVLTDGTEGNLSEIDIGNGLEVDEANALLQVKCAEEGGLAFDDDGALEIDSVVASQIVYDGEAALTSAKFIGFAKDTAKGGSASLMDAAALPPKQGETGADPNNAPLADVWVGTDESVSSKYLRTGTSGYAARADHKHPLETAIGTATEPTWNPGYDPPEGHQLDTTTWEAGTNGIWEAHCTRVIEVSYFGYLIFRDYKYSKNGNLIYRGPEYVGSIVELP